MLVESSIRSFFLPQPLVYATICSSSTMPPQSPNYVVQQMCNAREKGRERRNRPCSGRREEEAEKTALTGIKGWNAMKYSLKCALHGNQNVFLRVSLRCLLGPRSFRQKCMLDLTFSRPRENVWSVVLCQSTILVSATFRFPAGTPSPRCIARWPCHGQSPGG